MNGIQDVDKLLADPISFNDLIGSGTTLQMNTNFENGILDDIYDEVYGSDDDADDKLDNVKQVSPWLGSFEELRAQMTAVDDNIYKRILRPGNIDKGLIPKDSRVNIRYSSYWQGEEAPFDSAAFSFNTGECNVLEGLEKAVCTMFECEKAQFIISYKLLFGELGCPPRIKKCADGLYEIELISITASADEKETACKISPADRKKFPFVIKTAKEWHLKGLNFSKQGMYGNAVKVFEKASDTLDHCQLANDEEEKEQTKFLIMLYTNLMVAYNKLRRPNKTCIIYRKIRPLTKNNPSCKVLFQQSRALSMLGEYTRAKGILQQAQLMEPDNIQVKEELEAVKKLLQQLHDSKECIRKNMLSNGNADSTLKEEHLSDFKKNMLEILQVFKNNSDMNTSLPSNLKDDEISIVDELANKLNMKLVFSETEKSYYIHK